MDKVWRIAWKNYFANCYGHSLLCNNNTYGHIYAFDKKRFIKPNEIYQYCIDLGPISIKLNPGMKLRLQISSSNFPAYATNTNLKNNDYPTTDFVSANQIIYHDSDHPSSLVFDGIK